MTVVAGEVAACVEALCVKIELRCELVAVLEICDITKGTEWDPGTTWILKQFSTIRGFLPCDLPNAWDNSMAFIAVLLLPFLPCVG